jgi:hypothetical protein
MRFNSLFVVSMGAVATLVGGCGGSATDGEDGQSSSSVTERRHRPDAGSPSSPDSGTPSQPDSGNPSKPDSGTPETDGGGVVTSPDASVASGGDGGSVGGVPGGQVGVGTTLAGCTIFPSDNAWNVAIDGPDVEVIHTYDANLAQTTALHADIGGQTSNNGGIPYNVVPASQPDLTTVFSVYASESDPGPGGWIGTNPVTTNSDKGTTAYPFFVGMEIEGDPAPGGTPGSLPNDQHGIVLQQGADGCTSYEAWNCEVVTSAPFECANGAVFNLTSNALRPAGWTSADVAGLSVLAGLVKLSEVQAGVVTHAIRVTFDATQNGYIAPATHAGGSHPLGSAYPPMGLRLRLKASVATSSYTAASQVIMAAMKKYGLIVADNGSNWFFTGDSNDGWNATAPDGQDTLIDEVIGDFRKLTGADFEAVYTGNPVATGL